MMGPQGMQQMPMVGGAGMPPMQQMQLVQMMPGGPGMAGAPGTRPPMMQQPPARPAAPAQPKAAAAQMDVDGPLDAAALAAMPPGLQKQMIGEKLFRRIQRFKPDLAGKMTGMLLE